MTGYALNDTGGPGSSSADTSQYTMGLAFVVSEAGHEYYGFYWWVADDDQSTGPQQFALWESTAEHTGTFITGAEVTSGTLALGKNYIPLETQVALAEGQEYMAVTAVPGTSGKNGYSSTASYFAAGGAGQNGLTAGPVLVFSGEGGSSNIEPLQGVQMSYNVGGTDPTADYPGSDGTSSNYWLGIQIDAPTAPASSALLLGTMP